MQNLIFNDLAKQQTIIKSQIDRRIQRVLAHGQYIFGEEVGQLEIELARKVGVNHCVTVGSGTDALLISLMALNIGPGDEVIVPAFTFAATIEVVLLVGATPVLADIDPVTCNICCKSIKTKISSKTKAIIPVSLFGQVADVQRIMDLAKYYGGIKVIEDGAQSFGATHNGAMSCSLTHIGCTSFFPSKPLGCYGDGGALFTNDATLNEQFQLIRNHGQNGRYNHVRLGTLSRLDTIQAAILLAKLDIFDDEVDRRKRLSQTYEDKCEKLGLDYVRTAAGNSNIRAQFSILLPKAVDKSALISKLQNDGIPIAVHYPKALHEYEPYRSYTKGHLINAEIIADRIVSVPFHPYITDDQTKFIFEKLQKYVF